MEQVSVTKSDGKLDLWQYAGNMKIESEPEKSGCPKMHHIEKEKRNWENCKLCLRSRTDGFGGFSEWRACTL